MRHSDIYNLKLHLDTAELLLKGVKESLDVKPNTYESQGYTFETIPPEHSDESICRRLVQIRQECLQVLKKMNYRG
jgi:hypothetical protein